MQMGPDKLFGRRYVLQVGNLQLESWAMNFRSELRTLGLEYVWKSTQVKDINTRCQIVKNTCKDIQRQVDLAKTRGKSPESHVRGRGGGWVETGWRKNSICPTAL